jgi:hypothetical protein
VAAGTGIALIPEAVLGTFQGPPVQRHRLPAVHAEIVTPLVWRAGEVPSALVALHEELRVRSRAAARDRTAAVTGSPRALRSTA